MNKEKSEQVYKQALIKWGVDNRIELLIEEMGELITAFQHKKRRRIDNVEEEFADVEIVMNQLREVFNKEGGVDIWVDLKTENLKILINE